MRSWHPISKLAIGLGIVGLAAVWWTDGDAPAESAAVAGRAAQAGSVDAPSAGPARSMAAMAENTKAPPEVTLVARVLPPEATLVAMVDRPLFSPDRRPFHPAREIAALSVPEWAPEVAPAAGPEYPTLRFIGSIVEDGRVRAIVSDGFNVRGVVIGEEVEGWMVEDIKARRLTLALDTERLELTILE